ncbi:MAG: response regulator [Gemmatimonas sp.]
MRHALVVEADAGTRKLCASVLQRAGFTVSAVETGVAAVTEARAKAPDLILLDLQLRDVRGIELVDWLRSNEALRNTPMIAIGVLNEEVSVVPEAFANLIRKPVSRTAVAQAIADVLETANRRRADGAD